VRAAASCGGPTQFHKSADSERRAERTGNKTTLVANDRGAVLHENRRRTARAVSELSFSIANMPDMDGFNRRRTAKTKPVPLQPIILKCLSSAAHHGWRRGAGSSESQCILTKPIPAAGTSRMQEAGPWQ